MNIEWFGYELEDLQQSIFHSDQVIKYFLKYLKYPEIKIVKEILNKHE